MRYLTPEQVADQLGVSIRTVYEWLLSGKLRGLKAGRLWRVEPEEVERFLHGGTRPLVSWRSLEIFDADGYRLDYAERVEVLDAWRITGRLPQGHAFGPVDAAHEVPGGYGPRTPAEIDWAGFGG